MAAPVFVQASAGTVVTTGTGTLSRTGCVAGNVVFFVWVEDGASADSSIGNHSNVSLISSGAANDSEFFQRVVMGSAANLWVFVGRVTANGTVSADLTVGGSGADLFGVIYEFSGVRATVGAVQDRSITENGAGDYYDFASGSSTSIAMPTLIGTGTERLAVTFIGVNANRALAASTGETGGDWTEPVAEFASGSGTAATVGIQTSALGAGTISGGTITITSSAWGTLGFALIPVGATGFTPITVNVDVNY